MGNDVLVAIVHLAHVTLGYNAFANHSLACACSAGGVPKTKVAFIGDSLSLSLSPTYPAVRTAEVPSVRDGDP